MYINFSDNVGIGTMAPDPYKLAVEGTLGARKIKVTQVNPRTDYIFNDNYQLMPLSEIEQYIKINNHLPEVPSAKEVEKEGLDVGDNQTLLLKKIEELTLYMIIQQKQTKEIEKTNEVQQKENELLKQRIKKLENEK